MKEKKTGTRRRENKIKCKNDIRLDYGMYLGK